MEWIQATADDLDRLVDLRLTVLRAANGLPEDTPLPEVAANTRAYYQRALPAGECIIYFAMDGETIAGTGAVCFYEVMPTCDDPQGRKAFIMSMYTAPAYRRQGIATHLLGLLVAQARQRGVTAIALEATAMGRPLYARYGFVDEGHIMVLPT